MHRDDVTISAGNILGVTYYTGADGVDVIGASARAESVGSFSASSGASKYIIATTPSGSTSPVDALTVDSSGNVLVGTTTTDRTADAGTHIASYGFIEASRTSNVAARFTRLVDTGSLVLFRQDATQVGNIGTSGSNIYIAGSSKGLRFDSGGFVPVTSSGASSDNTYNVGHASVRFDDIYATNATIQTSDRNEKQDIEELSEAERRVAVAAKSLLRKFRWKDAVSEKGDDARIHFGIIAQDLQAAFEAEGLDAGDYAMFTSSTWWETQTEVEAVEAVEGVDFVQAVEASDAIEAVYDEEGELVSESVEAVEAVEGVEAVEAVEAKDAYTRIDTFETLEEAPEGATKRTRMGVRYSELLAFIIAAL